jgi:hypothetical protein
MSVMAGLIVAATTYATAVRLLCLPSDHGHRSTGGHCENRERCNPISLKVD